MPRSANRQRNAGLDTHSRHAIKLVIETTGTIGCPLLPDKGSEHKNSLLESLSRQPEGWGWLPALVGCTSQRLCQFISLAVAAQGCMTSAVEYAWSWRRCSGGRLTLGSLGSPLRQSMSSPLSASSLAALRATVSPLKQETCTCEVRSTNVPSGGSTLGVL